MRRSLGSISLALSVSFILSTVLVYWLVADDATKYAITQTSSEYKDENIADIGMTIGNNSVQLIVNLNKPMTCKELFAKLDITDLPLKNKVYSPACTTVQPTRIVVVYKEKMMV